MDALGALDLAILADRTRCPSCSALLTSPVCGTCGVDLRTGTATEVWQVSQHILRLAVDRDRLIALLRQEALSRRVPPTPAMLPVPVGPPVPAAQPAPAVPAVPPEYAAQPVGPPAVPRRPRLGVQGVLVGLGALLLAVAALVFLVFAWDMLGIGGRAAVVGVVTGVALGGAGWLRPRLEATGEAVGALAAVLVLADVWAVRRTGLLGADRAEAFAYWGAALLVAAVLLAGWALLTGVRAESVAAAAVAPAGAFLLGVATRAPDPDALAVGLGLVAAALLASGRRGLPEPWSAERVLLQVATAAALLLLPGVALATAVSGAGSAAALLAGGALAAVLGSSADGPGPQADVSAAVGGGFAAAAAALGVARALEATADPDAAVLVGPVLAAAALLVPIAAAAAALVRVRVRARALALGTLATTALLLVADLFSLVTFTGVPVLATVIRPWQAGPGASVGRLMVDDRTDLMVRMPQAVAVIAACAGVGLLLLAAVAVGRRRAVAAVRAEGPWAAFLLLAAAAVGVLLLPALAIGAAVVALALLAVAATVFRQRWLGPVPGSGHAPGTGDAIGDGTLRRAASGTLVLVGVIAGLLAVLVSWSVDVLSVPLTLAGAAALVLARPAVPRAARPPLVAAAVAATAVAAGGAVGLLHVDLSDRVTAAGLAGAALAAVLALPVPRTTVDQRVAGGVAGLLVDGFATVGALAGAGSAPVGDTGRLAVLMGALAAALLAGVFAAPGADGAPRGAEGTLRGARTVAAVGLPLAAAVAAGLATIALDAPVAASVAGAAVVAAVLLVLTTLLTLRPGAVRDRRRPALEAGACLAGLAAVLTAPDTGVLWVVLLLLGVAAAAVAVLPDRRDVGWLVLLLLTMSSWLRLWLGDVDLVEAYSLPPAAALLAVAVLRLRRAPAAGAWRALAPGASLAVTPSVLATAGGADLRPWLLLAAGAGLVTAGLVTPAATGSAGRRVGAALATFGALAAGGAGLVRPLAAVAASDAGPDAGSVGWLAVERWSVPAATVVLAAALVLALRHREVLAAARGLGLLPGLAVLAVPTWAAAVAGPDGRTLRFALAYAVLAVAALAAAAAPVLRPAGRGDLLCWRAAVVAAAGAGLVAATAWSRTQAPLEVFTVGAGALAVALGGLRLAAVPALRSWPALGGGLVLMLAPTVVLGADGALWRVLGLTVVAAAVVAAGAVLRLRAAVVVGAGALVAHAVVQVAPFVARLTTSQWRWVVFAAVGAGLLVLGATYERRLTQLRAARTALSALR